MNEYIVTRCDSNADGASRHPRVTMGTVFAANHREAMEKAHAMYCRNAYQWVELDNVKRAKTARVNAARRCNPDTE